MPTPKKTKLKNLTLDEISLVDRPANPGSHVLLFKRDDPATVIKGEPAMTDDEKKEFAALKKGFEDLTKAREADAILLAEQTAKAKMSDAEKTFMAGLDKEAAGKFFGMDPDERKKTMAAAKTKKSDGDEVLKIDGAEIRKSECPAGLFAVIKSQQTALVTQHKLIADGAETRARDIAVIKVESDYPNLPGEPAAKADAYVALAKLDEAERATVDAMLKAGNKALGEALIETGAGGGGGNGVGDAETKLNVLAKAQAKADTTTFEVGYAKVLEENPALYNAYLQEQAS